jgi:hypothetical protein
MSYKAEAETIYDMLNNMFESDWTQPTKSQPKAPLKPKAAVKPSKLSVKAVQAKKGAQKALSTIRLTKAGKPLSKGVAKAAAELKKTAVSKKTTGLAAVQKARTKAADDAKKRLKEIMVSAFRDARNEAATTSQPQRPEENDNDNIEEDVEEEYDE